MTASKYQDKLFDEKNFVDKDEIVC